MMTETIERDFREKVCAQIRLVGEGTTEHRQDPDRVTTTHSIELRVGHRPELFEGVVDLRHRSCLPSEGGSNLPPGGSTTSWRHNQAARSA